MAVADTGGDAAQTDECGVVGQLGQPPGKFGDLRLERRLRDEVEWVPVTGHDAVGQVREVRLPVDDACDGPSPLSSIAPTLGHFALWLNRRNAQGPWHAGVSAVGALTLSGPVIICGV